MRSGRSEDARISAAPDHSSGFRDSRPIKHKCSGTGNCSTHRRRTRVVTAQSMKFTPIPSTVCIKLTTIRVARSAVGYLSRTVLECPFLTVAISWMMTIVQLGTDPNATVRVGYVMISVVVVGAIVAAFLTGGLACHTARMMQELTLTRAEMQRVSCTDQLTGLLNRRGFDDAALLALAKAKEANLPVVALMRDIDGFK